MLHDTTLLNGIVLLQWLQYIWDLYLSHRQYKVCCTHREVPSEIREVITLDTFDKARRYSMARIRFSAIRETLNIIVSTLMLYYSAPAVIWEFSDKYSPYIGEVTTSCVWMLTLTVVQTIIDMPFVIYNQFVIEEEFGFNRQTARFFVVDTLKSFLVKQAITLPICSVIVFIVKYGGDWFFLWMWATISVITMFLLTIYPTLIAPLFDKYEPLAEGELRTAIEDLAKELKYPLKKLYVVEGSKRSAHSNAYMYGFGQNKRIVLYDTLLKNKESGGCSNDEVVAVLAHELGHWSYMHVAKNLVMTEVNLFIAFATFAYLFRNPQLYTVLGFPAGVQPVLVGMLVVFQYVMMPYNTVINFLLTWNSRRFEFQADEFAVKLGRGEKLESALVQLTKDNLGFPVNDRLYSSFHHSHPPLLERLEAIRKSQ